MPLCIFKVGLLGLGRSLQKDLNRIAEIADTSTSEGLHYVLTGKTPHQIVVEFNMKNTLRVTNWN